jgi:hypothetical protein
LFIPLSKADAAQRLIYGYATAELPDRSGEICDYATTKPYYEQWSADFAKATDGKSLGNLRAMHGKVAAGKISAIAFNDEEKRIEIAAKIVDDEEWRKIEEGVYTGFSQGGAYVKRWADRENPDFTRYTACPSEISLVDLPCLPQATFELVKADGAREARAFANSAPAPVVGIGPSLRDWLTGHVESDAATADTIAGFFAAIECDSQRRSGPFGQAVGAAHEAEKPVCCGFAAEGGAEGGLVRHATGKAGLRSCAAPRGIGRACERARTDARAAAAIAGLCPCVESGRGQP